MLNVHLFIGFAHGVYSYTVLQPSLTASPPYLLPWQMSWLFGGGKKKAKPKAPASQAKIVAREKVHEVIEQLNKNKVHKEKLAQEQLREVQVGHNMDFMCAL